MAQKTDRQVYAAVRALADGVIEQRTRQAQGWDKGTHRDDMRTVDRNASNTIRRNIQAAVAEAFSLSVAHSFVRNTGTKF